MEIAATSGVPEVAEVAEGVDVVGGVQRVVVGAVDVGVRSMR